MGLEQMKDEVVCAQLRAEWEPLASLNTSPQSWCCSDWTHWNKTKCEREPITEWVRLRFDYRAVPRPRCLNMSEMSFCLCMQLWIRQPFSVGTFVNSFQGVGVHMRICKIQLGEVKAETWEIQVLPLGQSVGGCVYEPFPTCC